MIIDKLIDKIIEKNNPVCVGIDTDFSYLPEKNRSKCKSLEDAGRAIFEFNVGIIDAVCDLVPCVKVQIAYYEKYGLAGLAAFKATCDYARERGLLVIADAKRNDIGSTASCYSQAFLGETEVGGKNFNAFFCDFLTVNPYLGSDGLLPFIKDCKSFQKGIFVLLKTSNPSSGELQDKRFENGNTLYSECGNLIASLGGELIGKHGYSSIGAVVGATHKAQAEDLRKRLPNTFFLIPGYGAQGGKAEDLKVCFDQNGLGGIVNSSRGIICAYKTEKYDGQSFMAAARNATCEMIEDLKNG